MDIKKEVRLTGNVTNGKGAIIAQYTGVIDIDDPNRLRYTPSIVNSELYWDNREEIRASQTEFEDELYAQQKKMLGEVSE